LLLISLALFPLGSVFAAQEAPPEKVGKETCLTCHELTKGFLTSVHNAQECEACHGPGSAHVDGGGDATLIRGKAAKDWVEACESCHALNLTGISDFSHSPHGKNRIGCRDCHQIHPEKSGFRLLAGKSSVDLCVECHKPVAAALRKPYHHPVLEGGMECLDCHNPHADSRESFRKMELAASNSCTSCHADKKGPFVFPHLAIEDGGCTACHQPHGGFNAKLLVRGQVYQLCLECHSPGQGLATSQPPAFHDIRSPRYRNCTTCHREIHGSNVNPAFVR